MSVNKRKHARLNMTDDVNSKDSKPIKGLSDSNKFTAQAKVKWQEKSDEAYLTGLEFINISVVR